MGHEIVYCFKCLTRLTTGEFEKGKAFRRGLNVSCKPCLPELLSDLSPEEQKRFLAQSQPRDPSRGTSVTLPAVRPSTTRRRVEDESSVRSKKGGDVGLVLGLIGGAALLLIGGLVALRSGPAPAPPVVTPPPKVDAPSRPVAEDPRLKPAREAIEKARTSPANDLDAKLALWSEALRLATGTPLQAEALEAREALLARRRAAWLKEVEAVAEGARPLLAGGEHAKAEELYDQAKTRRVDGEWAGLLSDRKAEVRREADALYLRLKERALEAARRGSAAELKAAEEQVAKLGYRALAADLRKELDAVQPPKTEAPPSVELLAYREAWAKAVTLAVAREFAAAAAEFERAARELKDEGEKPEAKRDAEDLATLPGLFAEAVKRLAESARGRDLSLEILDDEGARKRVAGKVLFAGSARVELSGEPTVFVELSDLSAGGVAEVLSASRKLWALDSRALSFLCYAEGNEESGAKLFSPVPAKYRLLPRTAASRAPRRSEREREARQIFHEAERDYRGAETRAAAVGKCRRLLAEFSDARIVKAETDLLKRRAEEGREYFIGMTGLKAGGSFRPGKAEKVDSCWTASEDTAADKAPENFVEFEFVAMPETAYRAWAYMGACCGETFGFSWQATDLTGPNPKKPSETVQAPPEGPVHLPLRHGLFNLKARHSDHVGPKSPKRWAWVTLPLPRTAAPGMKRVRLVTNQKGFSVALAFVSSTRTSPPGEAELKDLLARPKQAEAPADPALVGWWRLDERSGTAAADSSGKASAGELRGGAAWAAGRIGGAVAIGEREAHVSVPGFAPPAGALSVALWVRHDSVGGTQRYITTNDEAFILRAEGSALQFFMHAAGQSRSLRAENAVAAGAWMHVAGTWDGTTQKLYKDGAVVGNQKPGGTRTGISWLRMGNNGENMKGAIDDVRVYARALTDADVQALYATGLAGGAAPLPEEARPWQPIFDGKTTAFLGGGSENLWKVEGGALVLPAGLTDAAQSRESFEDGEFRFRFEFTGTGAARFTVRQGAEGTISVKFEDPKGPARPHEIVFRCKGEEVKATLDGQPAPLEADGKARRGHLQFGFINGALKVLGIERRDLP